MIKRILGILVVVTLLVGCLSLTGCGNSATEGNADNGSKVSKNSNNNKTFPVADFIPNGVEYKSGGTIEHTITGVESADVYIKNATLEDALSYVSLLKEKGLTYANPAQKEPTAMNEFGYFSWTGANSDDTFCVTVNFMEEESSFDALKGNKVIYNMSINLANENIYAE